MADYLLKSGILLLVFFAVYKLWLENEKMLRFNRIYLLVSLVFSLLIPLQLISFESSTSTELLTIQLDEVIIQKSSQNILSLVKKLNLTNSMLVIYALIVLVLTVRFLMNLFSFYKKVKRSEVQFVKGKKVVLVNELVLPHSFWDTIFINKEEFENGKISTELIAHETAHLTQKHSIDILFIEILQILLWFNPLIFLYKKAIKLNHEFLADEAVNNQFGEISKYQYLLLDIASKSTSIALASNINYSITKKRFLMMTKKESPARILLKVCSIGIISSLLLFVFSCKKDNPQESNTKKQSETEKISVRVEEKSTFPDEDDTVRNMASLEQKPGFPGGIEEFYKLVGINFKTPAEADKNKVEGRILIKFMVEKDGSLSNFKIEKDLGYGMGEEAIRVLKLSPKWIPGSENGKPVRVEYSMPITIQNKE